MEVQMMLMEDAAISELFFQGHQELLVFHDS